ncbi:MAG: 1,4-dihydroxy-6-naphthoate synthase [Vicingaceae bacterium]
MKKLSLGFSPCPNDTFIFDALVHQKIDTEGLDFEVHLGDVEELNEKAFKQELDITKLSYHAMAFCLDNYQLLNSGSALGKGVGPLLIAKKQLSKEEINTANIAIPGKFTTANFLLSIAFPEAQNKKELLFSDIESAVLTNEVDAGLIIHENRFTYQDKGLVKLMDLGDFWENHSGGLIPLGGIVIKRGLNDELKQKVDRLINKSIQYAFENNGATSSYVKENAQEMALDVIQKHIDLYVNQYSLDLGVEGRKAVKNLFQAAIDKKLVNKITTPIFV